MSQYAWILKNKITGDNLQLAKDPMGWQELKIKLYRSEQYNGIFQEPTAKQLTFLKNGGGKEFLDAAFAADDVNADVEIICLSRPHSGAEFTRLFIAKVNLAGREYTDEWVKANIEQSSLYQKIMSRAEVSVDLETTTSIGGETITAPTLIDLDLPGMEILYESSWEVNDGYTQGDIVGYGSIAVRTAWFSPQGAMVKSDFTDSYSLSEYIYWNDTTDITFKQLTTDYALTPIIDMAIAGIDYPITLDITVDFKGTITDDQTVVGQTRNIDFYKLNAYKGREGETATVETIYNSGMTGSDPATFNFDTNNYNFQVSMQPGEKLWLVWLAQWTLISGGCTIAVDFTYDKSTVEIKGITTAALSQCKTALVHEAFNQVVDAIADSDGNFYSELYGRTDSDKLTYLGDGEQAFLGISNGLNIRQFDKPIHCNFRDLYNSLDALHCIGMGIENDQVRVEKLDYFFNPSTRALQLPNVPEYTTSVAGDRYINSVKIGYERWEIEFKGGLDEPCTVHEYATQVNSIRTDYTKLSKYISSSYAIELTRRKSEQNFPKEDWRYDNDNFFFALGNDQTIELKSESFGAGSGMLSIDTAYNLRLTPKRMLLAHFGVITAGLQTINGSVTFQRGDGNTALDLIKTDIGHQEDYNGATLAENASLTYNDSDIANAAPLWLPEVYTFDYPITAEQFADLQTNPYGYIEFWKEPTDIKRGFLLSADYDLQSGLTQFKLLRKWAYLS